MYSLREFTQTPSDIAETLAKVKAIGYEAVQISGVEWYCVEQDDCYGRDPFDCLKISL